MNHTYYRYLLPIGLDLDKKILTITNNRDYNQRIINQRFYRVHKFKLLYIIHYLAEIRHLNPEYDFHDFIPLSSIILRDLFGNAYYKRILDSLIQLNIIESDNWYRNSEKCKAFRLTSNFRETKFYYLKDTKENITKKLLLNRANKINGLLKDNVNRCLYDSLNVLTIKDSLGIDYLFLILLIFKGSISINRYICFVSFELIEAHFANIGVSLEKIIDKDFFFVKGNCNRVYNNATNFPKKYRKYLSIDGCEELSEIDIKSSQPLLIGLITQEEACGLPIPDIEDYLNICINGDIYNYIMGAITFPGSRDEFKKTFFKEVYSRNNESKILEFFRVKFTSVYNIILQIKKCDYRELARRLQKMEAEIVLNGVVKSILQQQPNINLLTIHDSILCKTQDLVLVKSIMKKVFFDRFMVNIQLKTTQL